MRILSSILLWIPLTLALIGIIRLFKNKLTFRAKIFVAFLMLMAGFTPIIRVPIDKALVKHQKLIPPQLEIYMGYSEKGNLFVVADSKNDVPYKAREEMNFPKNLSGKMIKKYKMVKETPFLIDLPDSDKH